MAERLKDIFFTRTTMARFAACIEDHYPDFDKARFMKLLLNEDWESLELKQRMRHTSLCLHEVLPADYSETLDILMKMAPHLKGFEAMVLPDYVEVFGLDDWELSLPALGYFTRFSSSEFAIRPYLIQDPERAMTWMSQWAEDENKNVRRFSSEGCRPRLPWAMALPNFKKDPRLILPVLEKLKDDESDFVRKSVANNLNDISKDHPELVLDVCERWFGHSKGTDWIVKHACRTLLKSGNQRAMRLFGYYDPKGITISGFKTEPATIRIGENLQFSFTMTLSGKKSRKIRLEYGIDYMKANGRHSRKIFQISEKTFKPGAVTISRKHSFRNMTTRTHYQGEHRITILVNGTEMFTTSFDVSGMCVPHMKFNN